jgi:hypothetical protein
VQSPTVVIGMLGYAVEVLWGELHWVRLITM